MDNMREMKYRIELTEEQYNHIARCVETCHRIACGDMHELIQIIPNVPDDSLFRQLKEQAFPELEQTQFYGWNGGYKDVNKSDKFCEAFDKYQAMGYQIYREMHHQRTIALDIDNVYASPTLTTHKAEQPKIEVIKD